MVSRRSPPSDSGVMRFMCVPRQCTISRWSHASAHAYPPAEITAPRPPSNANSVSNNAEFSVPALYATTFPRTRRNDPRGDDGDGVGDDVRGDEDVSSSSPETVPSPAVRSKSPRRMRHAETSDAPVFSSKTNPLFHCAA